MRKRVPKAKGTASPKDISQLERKGILAKIEAFGKQAGRKNDEIRALQQHSLAVNRFVRALAAELLEKGAPIDYQRLSRASLWHDALRQRAMANVDFMTGKTRPSSLLGSEQRTAQDYLEEMHERAARELLKRGSKAERETAKLLSGRKWMRYNNPKARKHITLEQLIVDLGDAAVEGKKFVQIEKRLESIGRRMGAYSKTEKKQYRKAFDQLKKTARQRIEKKYGISIASIVKRLQNRV